MRLLALLLLHARVRGFECPAESTGGHAIPPSVFYTGKWDVNLKGLTMLTGKWPENYVFHYYDDERMAASMVGLDAALQSVGVAGGLEAFEALRPGAYKADLWRYCVIWACGGMYLDSKMMLALPFGKFLNRTHLEMPRAAGAPAVPKLITCIDRWVSKLDRYNNMETLVKNVTGIWQGMLVATPHHPDLLKVIRAVVKNVRARSYPSVEGKLEMLYITGPGTFARATQWDDRRWTERIHLPCHWGNHGPELRTIWGSGSLLFFQNATLHDSLRGGAHVSYGEMYKRHEVYIDDPVLEQP